MSVCWESCDGCNWTYCDCGDYTITECENYCFCMDCIDYYKAKNEGKLNEDWMLKKEFYEIKKKMVEVVVFK